MGYGYVVVVGFGIVVPVDLFLDRVSEDAETLAEAIEGIEDDLGLRIHREQVAEAETVFVTTKDAICDQTGEDNGSSQVINRTKIADELRNFVSEYFPEMTIELIFYSYYV